jgi:DNA-binding NarL/FixJ family response regulator
VSVSSGDADADDRDEQLVLIVDDHQLVGSSLVLALASRGLHAQECLVTATGDILRAAEERRSGLVLLDLELGVGVRGEPIDELELIAGLRARGWYALVVSAATDERRIAAAIAAGAIGYVPKAAPLPELLDTVCRATAGRSVLTPEERARWLAVDKRSRGAERQDRARWRRLTSRERAVLELLARGDRAASIAEQFCVSLTTVRAQIRSIHTKLDVNSQLEAVALLRRVQGVPASEQGRPPD